VQLSGGVNKNCYSWIDTTEDVYPQLISKAVPTVAFAEANSIDEPVQQMVCQLSNCPVFMSSQPDVFSTQITKSYCQAFVETGGKLEDCCLDGCSCDFRTDSSGRILPYGVRQGIPPYGLRGGQLDWIKTLKVGRV
jgi:hypothetical protein